MKLTRFVDPRTEDPHFGILLGQEVMDIQPLWEMRTLQRVDPLENLLTSAPVVSSVLEILQNAQGIAEDLRRDMIQLLKDLQSVSVRLREEARMALWGRGAGLSALWELCEELRTRPRSDFPEWRRHPLADVELLAPIQPPSFRDFYAFEQHVRNARRRRGLEMVPEWYEAPAFYFSNIASIVGPGAPIRKPPDTRELDYELEIAVVIGREGGDIPVAEADSYIAGFTILNDWSARDLQRQEMKVGLGPAKGKDFATSIGPYLVTPDELEERVLPDRSRGKRYDLTMTAAVNGKEYSRGNAQDTNWTFAELIAHASRNTVLQAGDLIGSGTVGTGCIVEFPEGTHPWLQAGDVVRLEIERLGVLENRVLDS